MRSVWAGMFRREEVAADLEEELRSHIAHRADDLQRLGLGRAEAERRARIEFGGRERYKEEVHAALGGNFARTLMQDVRVALRTLRKSPGFTVAAILTLALAIGANAVVFSVLNAFILRPLNVPDPQSLYGVWRTADKTMYESYPDYVDLRDRNRSFDSLSAWTVDAVGLDTGKNPSREWVEEASGNYFDGLGLKPYLGRFFHASDEHGPNSAPYVVLTYAFWHSYFQGDRGVVGRVVRVDNHPYTIIGVAPRGFYGTLVFFHPDFFVPLVNIQELGEDGMNVRGNRWIFMTMGHLKAGVTPAQADADLDSIGAYLARTYPKDDAKMKRFTLARPSLYGDYLGRPVRAFLTALMLLSGLILLAACANLGGLFAARAADRSKEVALRLALGSSRSRILRGLFTEAQLISLVGGAVGLAGSVVLLQAMSAWRPFARWPLQLSVNPDATVYGMALLLSLVSALLFGAVPVRQVLGTSPYAVVKSGFSGTSKARRRLPVTVRDVLLVVQIAICAVLVTSSLVAVRGLSRSLHDNFGFGVKDTLLVDTDPTMAGYTGDRVATVQKRMIDAVAAIPGVESVGLSDGMPLGDGGGGSLVFTDGASDLSASKAALNATTYKVSPGYLHAAGTALLSGRTFTWQDDKGKPRVAVVNREFARRVFGSVSNAMGGHFKMQDGTRVQVVGVAEDGKYGSLTEDPQAAMFLPILQWPSGETYLTVHSSRDSELLAPAIRGALRNLNSALPVFIETRYKELDVNLFAPRMATIALGVLGLMGALLSITGIFGMAAYSVSKRLKELGIRMALGAQRREILRAALGRAMKLLVFGSAAGLILGLLASRVLASIVYEATPRDPLVLAGAVLAMLLLGLVATWIPAQRALSVDPLILLREE
ncbi:MAG: ADOP family duplicated permease [Terracidiphilus sp.]